MRKSINLSTLKTGIQFLDHQNALLINSIDQYADAVLENQNPDIITRQLDQLINDTKFHFYTEEQIMIQNNYPKAKAHEQSHDKIIRRLITLNNMYKLGNKNMDRVIAIFFGDWIKSHIEKTDMQFAAYLNTQEEINIKSFRRRSSAANIKPLINKLNTVTNLI
ncbi:MAG: hemerythrin family protein [Gammaproteobacteria bacterium]|nr:hemerythrin family protein [Gammaproteobacteria bacterium]